MNLSVNGQSQVPPGFRFHPTEEELLHYYLRKKIANEKIDLDVIREVDLNKLEPWDIQEKCKIGSTPQNDWYLFSHKDKKYPSGSRTNRATAAGFWKATGRDKVIYGNCKRIGMRKTLVFYKGRAPHGLKLDWIMHEYRLDDISTPQHQPPLNFCASESAAPEEGWVVCRVFKKKSVLQSSSAVMSKTLTHENTSTHHDGVLDQILMYMGRSSKQQQHETKSSNIVQQVNNNDNDNGNIQFDNSEDSFLHLPELVNHHQDCNFDDEMIIMSTETDDQHYSCMINNYQEDNEAADHKKNGPTCDWLALVASQLSGHHLEAPTNNNTTRSNDDDVEFWSYAQSSTFDPLSQFNV